MSSSERILVTGGAGFIGGHLVVRLIKEGYSVLVLDDLSTASLDVASGDVDFVRGSIADPYVFESLSCEGISTVFHLAAQSSGEVSFDSPYDDFRVNAGGTFLLLDWCKRNNVKRFIYTSSMAVYGTNSPDPLPEYAPCDPKSYYGTSKLASEKYVRFFSHIGLDTTVVRLFNVYGGGQNLTNMKQGMASIYMSYVLRKEPITVKGSLDRFRDQTHVSDVVNGLMACFHEPAAVGKIYNLASGHKTTIRDLLITILKVSGNSADYPINVKGDTPGDLFGCYADITLAKKELGWECFYSLESGLREMYNYYVERKFCDHN